MAGEFDLIRELFDREWTRRPEVTMGIGDDAAIVSPPPGMDLVISIDSLNEGVHFPSDATAEAVGHKALAVNLSDLAAMGATPAWATLAISLPSADTAWLKAFMRGFSALADRYGLSLVGGDTTRGPLSITVQIAGWIASGKAVPRSGAQVGDRIGITGFPGEAAAGLRLHAGGLAGPLVDRLHRPTPRVEAGEAIGPLVNAMIDVSDGLVSDLGHVLTASGVAGLIELPSLPLSESLLAAVDRNEALAMALGGGDDYELCFTAAAAHTGDIEALLASLDVPLHWIGRIETGQGCRLVDGDGEPFDLTIPGYEHFHVPDSENASFR